MFDLFVALAMLSSMIFYNPMRIDGEQILSFMLMVFFAAYALMSNKKRSVNMFLPAIAIIMAVYTNALRFSWPSYEVTINLLVGVLAIKCIAERISLNHRTLGWSFLIWVLANLAFVGWQYFGKDPFYNPVYKEVAGTALLPWVLGSTAAISIPFIAAIHPLLCLLVVPLLIMSKSKLCCAVAVAGFSMLYFKLTKKWFALTTIVTGVATVAYMYLARDGFTLTRIFIWKGTFKYIRNYFFGNGIGSWAHMGFISHAQGDINYHWRTAHNEFYQHFFEQGVIGLVLLCLWIAVLLWLSTPRTRVVILIVCSLACFHPIFHFGRLTFILATVLSLAVAESSSMQKIKS